MNSFRSLMYWIVIIGAVILVWQAIQDDNSQANELTFHEFLAAVEGGRVQEVLLKGDPSGGEITGRFKSDSQTGSAVEFEARYPDYPDLVEKLLKAGVDVTSEKPGDSPLLAIFLTWGPILLLVGLWFLFVRPSQAGGNQALSFGKSKAKLLLTSGKRVTFDDIAGVEMAKAELAEVVEFLTEPQRFQKLGGKLPKGVLLMGPPGTGKTLLARGIAGEANVPFFSISGSDFVEIFVGVGASRVRDLFEQGKKNAPCIIFIDEIDAVGRHRGAGLGGGHDEREQTLNQLLVEMDGFETNEGVILIAATNRPDVLDPALMRPGRFDRRVELGLPDSRGRMGILQVHTKDLPIANDVDLSELAQQTWGFAGADLANLVNEATLMAARREKRKVEREDFAGVVSKVRHGIRSKLLIETSDDKWRIALHEAGHLSANFAYPCIQNLDSLSLYNLYHPEWFHQGELRVPTVIRSEVAEGTLVILLAGRAAEDFFLRDVSSISASDTAISTALAHQMVARWGMGHSSSLINDQYLSSKPMGDSAFLQKDHFEFFAEETKRLLDEAYATALQHVEDNAQQITEWASQLLQEESLSSSWINKVRSSRDFLAKIHQSNHVNSGLKSTSEPAHADTATSSPEQGDLSAAAGQKLSALARRREVLELQVATLGPSMAPAHIITELEDVKRQIDELATEA